jgi:hypothetical protein
LIRGHCQCALAAERAHINQVVGEALGHFREERLDEVDQMIEERVKQMRADSNESDDAEVLLLPNPLQRQSGQG